MAKKTRNYLALDLGAESGRGVVGRFDGKTISLEEVFRFPNVTLTYRDNPHWDVLQISANLIEALKAAVASTRNNLVSLGVDSWAVDYVLLDKCGGLLGYANHYRHPRNYAAMNAVVKKLGRKRLYKTTGMQFLPFNTLFQLYAEQRSGSGLLDFAHRLLFIPDFLTYAMGGDPVTEYSLASTSHFLDVKRRTWSKSLLTDLGLPTALLPRIMMPGTATGTLSPQIAARTGASPSLKLIAPCRHDTASAVAGVPASGSGWAYLSSGTWSLFGVESTRPVVTDDAMNHNFTNEGGYGGAIRLLKNIMGLWLVQELRRAWKTHGGKKYTYAELTALAAKAKPFGPVVNPNWTPFGQPGDMPKKMARFCEATGQKPPRTHGEFVRCALESLALAYREAKENVESVSGEPIQRIHCVGGGSQNGLLNQMTADACGCEVLAGPVEATALGNILVQMIADGQIGSLEEGRTIIRHGESVRPFSPRSSAKWNETYQKFRELNATRLDESWVPK